MWTSKRQAKKKTSSLRTAIFFILSFIASIFLMKLLLFYPLQSFLIRKTLVNPIPSPKIENKKISKVSISKIDEIKNLLSKTKIEISSVSASDSGFLVELRQGGRVIFSGNKPLSSQVSSLQLILSRLTIEGKGIVTLDLRFDRPILVAR